MGSLSLNEIEVPQTTSQLEQGHFIKHPQGSQMVDERTFSSRATWVPTQGRAV